MTIDVTIFRSGAMLMPGNVSLYWSVSKVAADQPVVYGSPVNWSGPPCAHREPCAFPGDEAASFTKEAMQQGKHQEYEKKLHDQLFQQSQNQINRVKDRYAQGMASSHMIMHVEVGNSTAQLVINHGYCTRIKAYLIF